MAKCCGQESYGRNQRPKNDRRLQLIDNIKQFLQGTEDEESRMTRGDTQRARPGIPGVRDMDEECLQYRKRRECSPPIITSLGSHEYRPTSNYDAMKYSNTKQVTFVDATRSKDPFDPMPPAPWELPRTASQELRASTLYTSCDCRKRNGLQQDCQRWECGGRPECLAVNPGPCCVPSKGRKPVRGDRRHYKWGSGAGDLGKQQWSGHKEGQNVPSGPETSVPTVVCLCGPAAMGQSSKPQAPPLQNQQMGPAPKDIVGVCALTSSGPQPQAGMSPPPHAQAPKGVGMMCFCQPA